MVIILILALSVLALQQLEANGRVNLDWLRNTVGMVLPVENLFPAPAQPTVVPVEPTSRASRRGRLAGARGLSGSGRPATGGTTAGGTTAAHRRARGSDGRPDHGGMSGNRSCEIG